jgi:hypothetical protein
VHIAIVHHDHILQNIVEKTGAAQDYIGSHICILLVRLFPLNVKLLDTELLVNIGAQFTDEKCNTNNHQ